MDFGLNAQQQELRKKYCGLFCKEIAPNAAKTDETEAIPAENWKLLAESGYLGIAIPKEYGGAGEDHISAIAAAEELSTACASTAFAAGASAWVCAGAIAKFGSDALKKKWLPELATGKAVGAFAVTDPGGGHLSDIKLQASLTGNGYELSGDKAFVTNAATADVFVVAAVLDGKLSAFVVEKSSGGIKIGDRIKTMGLRGAQVADMQFDKCAVPAGNILGAEGDGEKIAAYLLDLARLHTAVLAVGIGRNAYEEAKKRAETRVSGGKPIGVYQEVSFKIADMFIEADTARQLCYFAAWSGMENHSDARSLVAVAKIYSSELAVRNANRAVQICGGYGYSRASAAERLYRDAKYTEIGDGTSEVLRMYIADELLKD